MKSADKETLREAIARNAGAVLSLPSAGMLRHHRTRLLAPEEDGFWLEAPAGEKGLIDQLSASEHPVGVSLKSGASKVVFTTFIRTFQGQMQINTETAVDALLLAWPEDLKAIQRRSDYRVQVPIDGDVAVKVWRIPEHHFLADKPPASAQITATLRDMSVGGMGIVVEMKAEDPKLTPDQRLRVTLHYADNNQLLLEGRVKHIKSLPSGKFRVGCQFKKMQQDLEGRQAIATITHIVGQLQRDEIRRRRLGRTG
jgi:c-di-GMP-binding flagellar brake protein YcgR